MNGTSVVECSNVKLSNTNVKLDTAQTSICLDIGGKLLETLRQLIEEWSAPYTVYCESEQKYEYSVPFPTRIMQNANQAQLLLHLTLHYDRRG